MTLHNSITLRTDASQYMHTVNESCFQLHHTFEPRLCTQMSHFFQMVKVTAYGIKLMKVCYDVFVTCPGLIEIQMATYKGNITVIKPKKMI